jgi:hypothetical protein
MRTIVPTISVLALGVSVTGCFPMRFTVRPGVSGTVVDSQTHTPVAGAEVFFSRAPYSFYQFTNQTVEGVTEEAKTAPPPQPPEIAVALSNATPPLVFTDMSGRFVIPPTKRRGVHIVPMDVFAAHATLVVRRDGYAPELRLVYSRSTAELDVPVTKTK